MRLKKVFFWTVAVLVLAPGLAFGMLYLLYDKDLYVPEADSPSDLYIRGGTLFDGTSLQPRPNPGILLRNGIITCMGEACQAGNGVREISAEGLAVVPGLIDLHVHFFARTRDNAGMSLPAYIWDTARFRPEVRKRLLESGVTSVRSVGDPREAILEMKRKMLTRELAGPRLFAAGPIITAPGGHPAYGGRDPNPSGVGGYMAFQSNDPAILRNEVALLADEGADGIKAVYHGATDASGRVLPTFSKESFEALLDEARTRSLWVAVHVGPGQETREAVLAGATSIEHGIRAGNIVDEQTLRVLVENQTVYVPTLGREPEGHLNIRALYEAGVIFGVGTDTNNPEMAYGDSYHEELQRMVAAGMPPAAVLKAATSNSAQALLKSAEFGSIEPGKLADLLIVRGEPWDDIEDLRDLELVIQDGYVVVDQREQ